MLDFIHQMPWVAVYIFFVFGAFVRGHVFYSISRFITDYSLKYSAPKNKILRRFYDWQHSEQTQYGKSILQKWGLIAIPLAYITVGIQTFIFLAAGVIRMNRLYFAVAQIPGCLAWAAIYTTIGFTLWKSLIASFAGSKVGIICIVIIIITIISCIVSMRYFKYRNLSKSSQ